MTGPMLGWVRWHAPELAAVTATTTAAATWSPWWAIASAGLLARWGWQEWRDHTPTPSGPGPDGGTRSDDERDEVSA